MGFNTLTNAEIAAARRDCLIGDFQKIDAVLSGRFIPCEFMPNGPAPSWTDGTKIYFNLSDVGNIMEVEELITLNGLNYHELSHVLYTPRHTEYLTKNVIQRNLEMAYNILEDQRIETLFLSRYAATTPYFVNIIMKFLASDESAWDGVFPLTHGRRYLKKSIRQEFRRRFAAKWSPAVVREMENIIDEYRLMMFSYASRAEQDRALLLIQTFSDLLKQTQTPQADPYGHGDDIGPANMKGTPSPSSEQEKDQERAEAASGAESDGDGDGDSDGEDGQGSGDSDAAGDGKSQEAGSSGNGLSNEKLRDAMDNERQKAVNSEEVRRDVAAKQSNLRDLNGGKEIARLPEQQTSFARVDPMLALTSRKFANELRKITEDLDPGWKTHQSSGKLNMRRAIQQADYETVFDSWHEGRNDTNSMEVMILVDISDSMRRHQGVVSKATWAVKHALENLSSEVSVTAMAYNTDAFYIARHKTTESSGQYRLFPVGGGTEPYTALKEAQKVFAMTKKKKAVLIILTDGAWVGQQPCNEIIAKMNKAGVTTALFYVDPHNMLRASYGDHNAQVVHSASSPSDLIPFSKGIVKEVMKK